jgi:uncharacterized membrane protein YkgB
MSLGAVAFLAGLDKFLNLFADWPGYLSPLAAQLLPMTALSFMHIVGVIEMALGAALLAGFTQIGGYVVAALLAAIAINLITTGRYFDIAVRDVAMAIAASRSRASPKRVWRSRLLRARQPPRESATSGG